MHDGQREISGIRSAGTAVEESKDIAAVEASKKEMADELARNQVGY